MGWTKREDVLDRTVLQSSEQYTLALVRRDCGIAINSNVIVPSQSIQTLLAGYLLATHMVGVISFKRVSNKLVTYIKCMMCQSKTEQTSWRLFSGTSGTFKSFGEDENLADDASLFGFLWTLHLPHHHHTLERATSCAEGGCARSLYTIYI